MAGAAVDSVAADRKVIEGLVQHTEALEDRLGRLENAVEMLAEVTAALVRYRKRAGAGGEEP